MAYKFTPRVLTPNINGQAMPDANTELMQSIYSQWGAAIAAACDKSSVPPAFLAALVANESGGNPNAHRFEKGVLASLWEVLAGRATAFGSIDRDLLLGYIVTPAPSDPPAAASNVRMVIAAAIEQLDGLASSWGLTQIMGYEAIPFRIQAARLADVDFAFTYTLRLLAQFALRFDLDLSKDFGEIFDCWNTGRPHAPTADPQYVPNGLARMAIYQTLLDNEPPKAVSA